MISFYQVWKSFDLPSSRASQILFIRWLWSWLSSQVLWMSWHKFVQINRFLDCLYLGLEVGILRSPLTQQQWSHGYLVQIAVIFSCWQNCEDYTYEPFDLKSHLLTDLRLVIEPRQFLYWTLMDLQGYVLSYNVFNLIAIL